MAAVPTAAAFKTMVETLEKTLVKVQAAKGSNIKLIKAETDFLSTCEKARDGMLALVHNKADKNREVLLSVIGGDCMLIAKAGAVLAAAELSEKNTSDRRVGMAESACKIIEGILADKLKREKITEAHAANFPWKPPASGGAAEEPAAPEPAPAPAPASEPAPAAQPKAKAGTLRGPNSAEVIVTDEAEKLEEDGEDVVRKVTVSINATMDPVIEWGAGDTIVSKLSALKVTVETSIDPPLPKGGKSWQADHIEMKVDEMSNLVFDPKAKTPADARQEGSVTQDVRLLDLPEDIEFSVSLSSQSPWGSMQLKKGKVATEVHYMATIDGDFAMEEGEDGTNEVTVTITCNATSCLSGPGSANFTEDGVEMAAPEIQA
eukprot:TRINITY_DN1069_c0_g1_i1.p1 TRINITY_DN1069_c0_g1~~TRINITY_DN1069_c0_g1_i1.p1  ORF type:complete len:376 (-),score=97.39 TRINITY_DN1069_c0_g1_i1:138-1265(-)